MRFEKHARNHRQIRNGFTLIELMVVLAVIGMLMAIRSFVLPKFFTEKELQALGDATP